MDPQLQQKIEEARAAGYTDDEINQYLATQNQPVQEQQPINRNEEYTGLAEGMGTQGALTAAKYATMGAAGGAALAGFNKLMNGPKTPPSITPIAPSTLPLPATEPMATIGNAAWDQRLRQPPATPPTSTVDYATKVIKNIALNKVMQGAGALSKMLPAATVGANLFGTGADEIAILKAAEEKRKQQGLPY